MKTLLDGIILALYSAIVPVVVNDKVQHFAGSAVSTAIIYAVTGNLEHAVISVVLIGVAKEVFDAVRPKGTGFDVKDLIADVAGIGAVALPIMMFHWRF